MGRQEQIEMIQFVMRGFAVEEYGGTGIDHKRLAEKLVDNGIGSAGRFEIKAEWCGVLRAPSKSYKGLTVCPIDYKEDK